MPSDGAKFAGRRKKSEGSDQFLLWATALLTALVAAFSITRCSFGDIIHWRKSYVGFKI